MYRIVQKCMKLYRIVYSCNYRINCMKLYRIVQIISISRSLLFGQSLLRQPQLHRKPTQAARWTWTRSVPFGSEQFAVKYKIIVQLTTMIFPFGFALRPNTVDVIQTNTVCKGVVMPKKLKGTCKATLTMRKTPEIFQQRLNTIPAYSS